jgi:hypothetical protein
MLPDCGAKARAVQLMWISRREVLHRTVMTAGERGSLYRGRGQADRGLPIWGHVAVQFVFLLIVAIDPQLPAL